MLASIPPVSLNTEGPDASHANESLRLDLFDVNGLRSIEDCQMTAQVGLLHQIPHDGQRAFPDIDTAQRTAAKAENL